MPYAQVEKGSLREISPVVNEKPFRIYHDFWLTILVFPVVIFVGAPVNKGTIILGD
jgi:hypothetical protein